MAVRKRKPVEANDGSYGGMVLAAFDHLTPNPCSAVRDLRDVADQLCVAVPADSLIARQVRTAIDRSACCPKDAYLFWDTVMFLALIVIGVWA
jgi:hypothetical protein